jgi:hypothetical protein
MSDRLFEDSTDSTLVVVPAGRPGLGRGDVEMLDPLRDAGAGTSEIRRMPIGGSCSRNLHKLV